MFLLQTLQEKKELDDEAMQTLEQIHSARNFVAAIALAKFQEKKVSAKQKLLNNN